MFRSSMPNVLLSAKHYIPTILRFAATSIKKPLSTSRSLQTAATFYKQPTKQMKAQVIEQHGDLTVFKTLTVETPQVKSGHVLIRVAASSVNPVDYKIRKGLSPWLAPALPAILHGDVAGTVVAVGEQVEGFKIGDEVYGCAGGFKGMGGALAEFMLADVQLLAHKPSKLTMVESAALPLVSVTAFEALFDRAKLQPGQTILIQGAAGGVGHIAIQLAKAHGAIVYATASSARKLDIAYQYGAIPINYKDKTVQEYTQEHTQGKGFDVVMNTVGGPSLNDAFYACANNGVVTAISSSATYDLSLMHKKGLSLHLVFMPGPLVNQVGRKRQGEILKAVTALVNAGSVVPLVDRVFDFSQVGAAHQYLEAGKAVGKVGLTQDLHEGDKPLRL